MQNLVSYIKRHECHHHLYINVSDWKIYYMNNIIVRRCYLYRYLLTIKNHCKFYHIRLMHFRRCYHFQYTSIIHYRCYHFYQQPNPTLCIFTITISVLNDIIKSNIFNVFNCIQSHEVYKVCKVSRHLISKSRRANAVLRCEVVSSGYCGSS